MSCDEFQVLLADYLGGSLDREESRGFAAHALRCLSCRATLDDVKARLREDDSAHDLEAAPSLTNSLESIPGGRTTLECSRFQDLITEFLDGFVPAPTYHRFGLHSAQCDDCAALVTDVVYAVAACHSVHTYEELDVPAALVNRLIMIGPGRKPKLGLAARLRRTIDRRLDPLRYLQSRLAGGSALVCATLASLLIGFSDDMTFAGIYRQAHVKAAVIYDRGIGIYSRKDDVAAQVEMVGSDLSEVLGAIAGEPESPARKENQKEKDNR